jgi:hypothetical protein
MTSGRRSQAQRRPRPVTDGPVVPTRPADQSPAHESIVGGEKALGGRALEGALEQPHERDQGVGSTSTQAGQPDPQIEQAARDLAAGQVDTDLRATPGLDADRRGDLVEGGEHGATRPPGSV